MKKFLLATLVLTIHLSAFAEPGKKESIQELFELINVDSIVETAYSQLAQKTAALGEKMGIKPSEQELFDNFARKMSESMREQLSFERMVEPVIDIYAENYTELEIQDMLTFYRSSTGRSVTEKMPIIMVESVTMSMNMMEGFLPKMKELAAELFEEVKAHRESQ